VGPCFYLHVWIDEEPLIPYSHLK